MEFYFWKASDGKLPVKEFIRREIDKQNAGKFWQRLEFFRELSISSMGREQHLGHYDHELDYLRIILKGVYCRIFCIVEGQKCILFHALRKKECASTSRGRG